MGPVLSTASKAPFSTVLVNSIPLTPAHRARLEAFFPTVHHHLDRTKPPPADLLAAADVLYGFPHPSLTAAAQVPRLQLVQLASAGSERALESPLWREAAAKGIKLATAAGVHTGPIPQVSDRVVLGQGASLMGVPVLYMHGARTVQQTAGANIDIAGALSRALSLELSRNPSLSCRVSERETMGLGSRGRRRVDVRARAAGSDRRHLGIRSCQYARRSETLMNECTEHARRSVESLLVWRLPSVHTSSRRTRAERRRRRTGTSSLAPATPTGGASLLALARVLSAHLCRASSIPEAWYSTKDRASFAEFLGKSDVVLLSLPSTPATRHILSAQTLPLLKRTAVIVNIGRGDAVETDALVAALDAGLLAGAALDVTEPEPLPAGHALFGRKNVILTPHLSGRTVKYFDLALDIFIENLVRLRDGKPLLNVVDVDRGY